MTSAPAAPGRAAKPGAAYSGGSSGGTASASMPSPMGGAGGISGIGGGAGFSPFNAGMCGGPEHQELDKISTLNMIELAKGQQKLRPISSEHDEVTARYGLLMDQQRLALAPQEQELHELQLASALVDERFHKSIEPLQEEKERLSLENQIAREKFTSEEIKADEEKLKMDVAMRALDFESRKLRMETEIEEHRTVGIKVDLELREKREEWKTQANKEPEYPLEPFQNGVLTISDRRVTIDGPIVFGVADHVTERIHYFNNKDETLPIFVVIDDSPGGSVMEGYRIVKAIQTSKAPVHVVVKSFAASMAAAIATLAPHSYAYPNAIILHHQMSGGAFGNMTEQAEQLEISKEWFRRLSAPIAQKMGTNLDGFVKEMYKHNSDGDWEEFADKAVALKWVDHVVQEIRETGIVKSPDDVSDEKPKMKFGLAEETDARGDRFVRLPRLRPFDAYWIYNPSNYYR
jgi:ATP-dependent Clp protease protease subunit